MKKKKKVNIMEEVPTGKTRLIYTLLFLALIFTSVFLV